MSDIQFILSDVNDFMRTLKDESVDLFVTSPPYFHARNYRTEGQLGQENTYREYLDHLLGITKEAKRALKPTGSFWFNIGDSYFGNEEISSSLMLLPQRFTIKMQDEQGWQVPNYVPWIKPNASPAPFLNRLTNMYEPFIWFTKSKKTRLWRMADQFGQATGAWLQTRPQINQFEYEIIPGATKTGKTRKHILRKNYYGFRYFFDLELVRIPQKYPEDVQRRIKQDKAQGIIPFAKDNQDGVPWRRDQLKPGQITMHGKVYPSQMAYRKELMESRGVDSSFQFSKEKRYNGKFTGYGEQSEDFGSPRARNERYNAKAETLQSLNNTHARDRALSKEEAEKLFPGNEELQKKYIKLTHDTNNRQLAYTKLTSELYEQGLVSPQKRADLLGIKGGAAMSNPRGKNPGDIFRVPTAPLKAEHFAPFPIRLIAPIVMAWSPPGGLVVDPFSGSGTTALCCEYLSRPFIGCDNNEKYIRISEKRLAQLRAEKRELEKLLAPKIDFYMSYAQGMDKFVESVSQ